MQYINPLDLHRKRPHDDLDFGTVRQSNVISGKDTDTESAGPSMTSRPLAALKKRRRHVPALARHDQRQHTVPSAPVSACQVLQSHPYCFNPTREPLNYGVPAVLGMADTLSYMQCDGSQTASGYHTQDDWAAMPPPPQPAKAGSSSKTSPPDWFSDLSKQDQLRMLGEMTEFAYKKQLLKVDGMVRQIVQKAGSQAATETKLSMLLQPGALGGQGLLPVPVDMLVRRMKRIWRQESANAGEMASTSADKWEPLIDPMLPDWGTGARQWMYGKAGGMATR